MPTEIPDNSLMSGYAEHLPDHERQHIGREAEVLEQARHLIPYLRAGAEAHRRGEDFFGGSPTYDNQLRALNEFYGIKQPNGGWSTTTETAPVAPVAQTAPEPRKHGGAVSKQINSIHDTFKHKLEDKEKMIVSLEKAHERKPNTKLSKRIEKEKGEVARIRGHLGKITAHA